MTESSRQLAFALGVPLVPLAWNFVVPAFLAFLVGTTYVLTFGLVAAVVLWVIATVLLLLWLGTGLYPFNRLALVGYAVGLALVARAIGELAARAWRRARGRPRLVELRESDATWAGEAMLDLACMARAGVPVSEVELERRGFGARMPNRQPVDGELELDLFTRLPEGGPSHVARIRRVADGGAVEVDRLARTTRGTGEATEPALDDLEPWLALADRADEAVGHPLRLRCVRATDGSSELRSCNRLSGARWDRTWIAGAGVDLAADPVSTLERELVEAGYGWDRLLLGREARSDVAFFDHRPYVAFEAARGVARGARSRGERSEAALLRNWIGGGRRRASRRGATGRWTPAEAVLEMGRIASTDLARMHAWSACAAWVLDVSARTAGPDAHSTASELLRRIQRPEVVQTAWLHDGLVALERAIPSALREAAESWDAVRERLAGAPERIAVLDAFLRDHGHRGPGERTLAGERFADGPATLGDVVVLASSSRSSVTCTVRPSRAGLRLTWLDPMEWWLGVLARLGAAAMARRVRARDRATRALARLRAGLRAEGANLVAGGKLDHPDDIFHLRLNEWLAASEGAGEFRGEVRARRNAFEEACARPAAAIASERADSSRVPEDDAVAVARSTLWGIAASRGSVRGRVMHASTAAVADGGDDRRVLVLDDANPHHAGLLVRAGGLVCERGGVLSHLAIVARELGVPAVMGVPGATSALPVGSWVEVDGSRGEVRRLTART